MLCSHFVTDDVPKAFLYAMVYITMATQALFVNSDTSIFLQNGQNKIFLQVSNTDSSNAQVKFQLGDLIIPLDLPRCP